MSGLTFGEWKLRQDPAQVWKEPKGSFAQWHEKEYGTASAAPSAAYKPEKAPTVTEASYDKGADYWEEQKRQATVDMDFDAVNEADRNLKELRKQEGKQTIGDRVGDVIGAASAGTLGTAADALNVLKELLGVEPAETSVADMAAEDSARFTQSAKEGLGGIGRFLVDTGIAGANLLTDAAGNALIPGAGLALSGTRSFGGAAREAEENGASLGEQLAYGLGSAAAGMVTEKLGNTGLLKSAYGSGWLKDPVLGTLGKLAYSAVTEGAEEFAEGLFDPLLKNLTYDPVAVYDDAWLKDTLYDSAVGAALGTLASGVDVQADTDMQALAKQKDLVENDWEQDYTEYEESDNSIGNVHGLTRREEDSLFAYKSSESYKINAKLRENLDLDDYQRDVITDMDSALNKLPRYTGTVYRNIAFDDFGGEEAYQTFLDEHTEGRYVFYEAYTSTSSDKGGYPVEGKYKVYIEIDGSGRNVAGYGNNMEREIIYPRNSLFLITKVRTAEDGTPIICMQEVIDD